MSVHVERLRVRAVVEQAVARRCHQEAERAALRAGEARIICRDDDWSRGLRCGFGVGAESLQWSARDQHLRAERAVTCYLEALADERADERTLVGVP